MARISSALWRYSLVSKRVLGDLLRFEGIGFYREKKISFHLTKRPLSLFVGTLSLKYRGVFFESYFV